MELANYIAIKNHEICEVNVLGNPVTGQFYLPDIQKLRGKKII